MGQEGLVRSGGNVVLENMEDQLINDPELNLETAHEPDVVRGGAVQMNDLSIDGLSEWSIKLHVVSPVKPLGKTLAMVSRDLGPMREHINGRKKVNFHNCLAAGERGGILVEDAITVDRDYHERSPTIVLALVLKKLQKRRGRSH